MLHLCDAASRLPKKRNNILARLPMSTVTTTRIQYTPSPFARASLLHLAEVGRLTALKPHTSRRAYVGGFLLLVIVKGSGEVTAGGRNYRLGTGDVAFIDCSQPYSHSTGADLWTLHWAHFDGPAVFSIYSKFLARAGKPVFTAPDVESYRRLFQELFRTAAGASYVRDMSINTILSSILERAMGDCWDEEKPEPRDNVETIRLYMDSHYMEDITLEKLSQEFFLEKTYLGHIFSKVTGISPIKYLSSVRIRKTKELLRFTGNTLAEIAGKVGFL